MKKEFIDYYIDAFESLPRKAKELLFEEDAISEYVMMCIAKCVFKITSPIEKILLTALSIYQDKEMKRFCFETQEEIIINDNKYVADFYVYHNELNKTIKEDFKLVIECDGFDYHHTTKEQVNYDYKRENDMKLNGYDVIRFTGSQIYNNPMECAKQIVDYVRLKGVKRK